MIFDICLIYLLAAVIVGAIITLQNRVMLRRLKATPLEIAVHFAVSGVLWPVFLLGLRVR